MSGFADEAKKAEQFAKDHPDTIDKGVQEGEKLADQQTGDRFDKEVGAGGQAVENEFGNGQDSQNGQNGQNDQGNQNSQDDQSNQQPS